MSCEKLHSSIGGDFEPIHVFRRGLPLRPRAVPPSVTPINFKALDAARHNCCSARAIRRLQHASPNSDIRATPIWVAAQEGSAALHVGRPTRAAQAILGGSGSAARRSFQNGKASLRDDEIIALGYEKTRGNAKHRYARGLTRSARRASAEKARPSGRAGLGRSCSFIFAEGFPSSAQNQFGSRGLVPLQEKKAPPKRGKDYPGRKIKMKLPPPTCKSRLF